MNYVRARHYDPATAKWLVGVIAVPENVVKLLGEWHASHAAPLVGIWLLGAALGTKLVANTRPGP